MLAQFFETLDDDPVSETAPPAVDEPLLEGLELEGLDGTDAGEDQDVVEGQDILEGQDVLEGQDFSEGPDAADGVGTGEAVGRVPGWAAGAAPGSPEEEFAGDIPPAFDLARRPELLAGLYDKLSQVKSASDAAPITTAIEQLWAMSGSDTVDLLLSRANQFANGSDVDLSLAVLDAVVDIAPEEPEAWHLRSKVNVIAGNPERALADLRRTLALDEKHYRAITDLGLVLEQLGAKKEALKAYRQALAINPFMDEAQAGVDALQREVEGQDI